MKITTKVALSAALFVSVLYAVQRADMALVHDLSSAHREVAEVRIPAMTAALALLRTLEEGESSLKKLFVTRDEQYAAKLDRLLEQASQQLATFPTLATSAGEQAELTLLNRSWNTLTERLRAARGELTASQAQVSEETRRELLAELASVRGQTVQLFAVSQDAIRQELSRASAAAEAGERRAWVLVALAVAAGVVFVLLIHRSVRRPLVRLVAATRDIAAGKFVRLSPRGQDEFAELGRAFDAMLDQLAQVDRMKRDFLSRISHELKTPLATMQEAHQFMSDGLAGPLTERQRHMLELNRDAARRLSLLLSRLLDSARLDAGAVTYDVRLLDYCAVVREAWGDFSLRLTDRGLEGVLDLTPQPCWIYGDADWLKQVVSNLVDNAIKVSPRGGRIAVTIAPKEGGGAASNDATAQGGATWVLCVADQGPGVPPEDRHRIFERFVQLSRTPSQGSGVGLGLAICRDIVSAHGGSIWVESQEGGGCRFKVALPQAPAARASHLTVKQGASRVEEPVAPVSVAAGRLRDHKFGAG